MSTTKPREFSETQFRRDLAKQLRGNYSAGWDEDRDALCSRVLKQLLEELGPNRLEEAVHRCTANEQFFSEQALRRWIPQATVIAQRCPRCEASCGWLYVLVDGSPRAEVIKCPHDTQVKFTVHKRDIHGQPFSREATACDMVPA